MSSTAIIFYIIPVLSLLLLWVRECMWRRRLERELATTHVSLQDALHDTLTGLPTKGLLEEKLQDALKRHTREIRQENASDDVLVLFFMDINNLKTVNDTYGHNAGNRLLIGVGDALREATRESDIIGRLHGDEYIAAGVYTNDHTRIELAAQRILDAVQQVVIEGASASASLGIAIWEEKESVEMWQKRADAAMYRAKKSCKNCFSW